MKKPNPRLQEAIMEVVDNQLRDLNPPETKKTFDRLISEGHSEPATRHLIACVVATEIFVILDREEPFDHARFVKALDHLPKLPVKYRHLPPPFVFGQMKDAPSRGMAADVFFLTVNSRGLPH